MIRLAYWPRWKLATVAVGMFVTSYAWVSCAATPADRDPETPWVEQTDGDPIITDFEP